MMHNSFRQSMAWLHTWVGLVLGWLIFTIFIMGTASYFKSEINQWMHPEAQFQVPAPETAALIGLKTLDRIAPHAESWYLTLPTQRAPLTSAFWKEPGENGQYKSQEMNPLTGEKVIARDSLGGDFFYQMHYQLFGLPSTIGRIIVGIGAMFMLVALISGVITHKKIFKEFFTFRPKKGQRSWLDFHNFTAVVALPFFLMITYTGLAIFFYLYIPWGLMARFGSETGKLYDELQDSAAVVKFDSKPINHRMQPFELMIQQTAKEWQLGSPIGSVEVKSPNTDQAVIAFTRMPQEILNNRLGETLSFNAVTGTPLPNQKNQSVMAQTGGVIYGLHEAHLASWPLRWLLFFSGLLGTVMIATGLILWTVKRRVQNLKGGRPSFGHYLVERLNIAAIAGLPIAMAGYFWANRLISAQLASRSDLEIRSFFIFWLLSFVHALVRPWQKAWREQLAVAAILFMGIPFINMMMTPGSSLLTTLGEGHTVLAAFDLTVFGVGLFFACATYKVMQPKHSKKHNAKRTIAKTHHDLHAPHHEEVSKP
ncbi:PepSY-associated TM helix domain-containing protein [Aquirhabdus parva]|uniref:PepSY domain-containing protein n=1 Tax=Aquirhabdus parva TaxID=2283318 RepID=A0A345P4I1_9GAMM|nr:PepSY-associated TM helix domain-containing protein [Aquirhabdus parva]AXI02190.1 PepSY domain-containing protein [Aquirhabdus parva]